MEFDRYVLRKKWWQYSDYVVIDGEGQLVCTSSKKGLFRTHLELYDANDEFFLAIRPSSVGSVDHYFETNDGVIATFLGSWSGQNFKVHQSDETVIEIGVNSWNNKINFYLESEPIGIASANSYFSEMGCAVSRKAKPQVIIPSLILIGYLKATGYC